MLVPSKALTYVFAYNCTVTRSDEDFSQLQRSAVVARWIRWLQLHPNYGHFYIRRGGRVQLQ
jgi:hypothetical protein